MYLVKTQKLQVRGTPCKCCSRSQQRSSPGLPLRLTPLLVLIERVWWISHYHHFCSFYILRMTKHISHTCGRRSCRPARYLSSSTHSHISKRCLATAQVSSSITTRHYALNKDGSKASGFRKQCHEGSTTSSQVVTPLVYSGCSTCSSKLNLYFSWNAYVAFVGDPSYSLVLDWRRSRSPRRSIHMNEPKYSWTRDERSGLFVKFNRAAKLRTDLLFVHLVCKGHFRISNVPPYSTVSLDWIEEYPDNIA